MVNRRNIVPVGLIVHAELPMTVSLDSGWHLHLSAAET